jgi:hypothetical protein
MNEMDLTTDGFSDTTTLGVNISIDLQIIRTTGTGNPLLDFQISNDGVNWTSWELEGFIFKDPTNIFEITQTKPTFFRLNWLSNGSTGTFTANYKELR